MLTLQQLTKKYNNRTILNNVSLTINKSQLTVILGPSGCGKSTLLQMIAGLDSDYEGTIYFNNKLIQAPSKERMLLFQTPQLLPWLTTIKNATYGLNLHRMDTTIANELLNDVGLYEFKHHYPHQLSGGMQQRLALVRALTMQPQLLLCDEPFSALDSKVRYEIQQVLLNIHKKHNNTILFITHDVEEAIILADRIIVFDNTSTIVLDIKNNATKRDLTTEEFIQLKQQLNSILLQ